jgi:hypothetical protein
MSSTVLELVEFEEEGSEAEMQRRALQALENMAQDLLGRGLSDPQEVTAFGARVEEVLSVFIRSFVAQQKGHQQLLQSLDIRGREVFSSALASWYMDAKKLAATLLAPSNVDATRQLESAFKNILFYQVALLSGVMTGFRTLLSKLSPDAISRTADKDRSGPDHERLWDTFKRAYRDLSDGDGDIFQKIFGSSFDTAYQALSGKTN